MADALCGPSNPLQNFQKHSSVDRSLQQDRLSSRAGASQGFRSDPGARAGVLDPEFEAFQAGHSSAFPEAQILPQAHLGFQPSQHPPGVAGWASDFQRLRISQPPLHSQPQALNSPTPWHLDFQRQENRKQPALQQPQQSISRFQNAQPSYNFSSGLGMQRPYSYGPMTQNLQSGNFVSEAPQQVENYDAAAFEQEFEAHAARLLQEDAESQVESKSHSVELGQDVLMDGPDVLQSFDENSTWASLSDPPRYNLDAVGNLTPDEIVYSDPISNVVEPKEKEQPQSDHAATDEDLARTAGELLHRVKDDTSVKFRESNFLQFMMQLRDGELRVEGNEFVATADASTSKAAEPSSGIESDSTFTSSFSPVETTSSVTSHRPSSVPPRRNPISIASPDGDLRMAGALRDSDGPVRSSSIGRGRGRQQFEHDFEDFLNQNGVPSTHMVDDF